MWPVYILLLITLVVPLSCERLEKGENCVQDYGFSGKCKLLHDCPGALEGIKNGTSPKICGFDGVTPVVCCTEVLLRKRMAVIKCFEYYNRLQKIDDFYAEIYAEMPAVGGELSVPKEFPHMAALGYGNKTHTKWLCGGTLISERYILTAAHCLNSTHGPVQFVRLGDLNLFSTLDEAKHQDFQVSEITPYPAYKPSEKYHDIALLKLDRPVTFDDHIKPACLHDEQQINETVLTATGWGLTEPFGEPSDHLVKVNLDLYSDEECQRMYRPARGLTNGVDTEGMICAGGRTEEKGTCNGDSGGPLQSMPEYVGGPSTVYGVTSFGIGCAVAGRAGVYTRVSRYVPWIERIVWS